MGKEKPLYSFTSHINGKNARVEIWPDRLEWERSKVSAFKVVTGAGFVTGGFRNKDTDMLPIRQIASVTSKKGLGLNTTVTVHSSGGGSLEFRCSHKEGEHMRQELNRLILEASQQTVIMQAPAAVPAAPDVASQLVQLKSLLDAGVLSEGEYSAKKTELLGRM